ncbi:hypothetical protein GCM10014713_14360 [Streptomyces purpureus]|uniref:Uncharacterized protein n=1 Tax=Streptomyces purpureus TaxID=1951 RepID=A0A918GZL8_9ACTN|nr:hypothetical protein GCM10014713_14360 [Streptomyces purpureus]
MSSPRLPRRTPGATNPQYEAAVAAYAETDAGPPSERCHLPRAAEAFRTEHADPATWNSGQCDAFLGLGGAQ